MAKVLLVEDDNNLREIYEARLQAEGYDIAVARDGEEALVVAKQEQPDLVISDVMMPKISGFEMLDIMRNTDGLRDVKVIMLTALGQSEDQSRADKLGADRYLVKSQVTLEDIVNAAQDLLVEVGAVSAPATASAQAPAPAVAAAPAPTPVVTPPVSGPTPTPEPITQPVPQPIAVAPAPVTPLAAEPIAPVPAPAPVAPVIPEPAQPTPQPAAPEPADQDDQQSSSQESDTVQHQIDDFVNAQTGQPEAQVEPTVEVTPIETPASNANDTTPEQEQVLNEALERLGGAPEPEAAPATGQSVAAPASEPEAEHHSKVIEPLHDAASVAPAKSLDELLAAEEAKETGEPAPAQPAASAPTPAAPIQPTPQTPPTAPTQPPTAPKPNNDFDPNSIAL